MNYQITLYKSGKVVYREGFADQQAMYNQCLRLAAKYSIVADEWRFERMTQ